MMYEIAVSNSQSTLELATEALARMETIARDVLAHEQVEDADVSVAIIDGETMRRLNNEYLGHDYDTDVLSFSLADELSHRRIEGEILISAKVARRSATDLGWPAQHELLLYLVHGLLHLVGYDDQSEELQRAMIAREREHLARWELDPPDRGGS